MMHANRIRPHWLKDVRNYDHNGELVVPFWFWLALAWQLLPWWLIAGELFTDLDMAHRLYPDQILLITALVCGLPAFLMVLVYPLRAHFRELVQWMAVLLWGGMLGSTMLMAEGFITCLPSQIRLYCSLFFTDFWVLVMFTFSPRLWCVFFPTFHHQIWRQHE